ncbi:diacylglycerol/lipid kinase family protein [Mucilaginibacter pocheonensis]|uniref:YegS/Rv2252/BmrU family lipid kinase n=1 Tax=Mucilaginibacter pocheonensis TaxID=398050 RepID=A0ABU1TH91_9SPHI|nr:YegS/Rv2252/BmrU family lipid kinase [Mucilaginibacter pocheonensis]MDR6944778.1 YegS/Rv2252/BmrU family lipid kinase [Mucilaginibacter pocheonensis]
MKTGKLFILINPAAGKNEPILETINEVFKDSGLELNVHILAENEDPAALVSEAAQNTDVVAIYGGDGSVTAASGALIGTDTPLAIIPGGTANVMAKELSIPQDAEVALRLIRDGNYQLKRIDTGVVNDRPFLLRVNLGIMASMITETDPELKDKLGQFAYGLATIKTIREAEPVTYQLMLDGEHITATGVSLTITNSGSLGIGDLQLQPGISVSDGLLDVVLLKDAGLTSVIKAAGGSLLGRETEAVCHRKAKTITVTLPERQTYLCDDCEDQATQLSLHIVPASLTVIVPC